MQPENPMGRIHLEMQPQWEKEKAFLTKRINQNVRAPLRQWERDLSVQKLELVKKVDRKNVKDPYGESPQFVLAFKNFR